MALADVLTAGYLAARQVQGTRVVYQRGQRSVSIDVLPAITRTELIDVGSHGNVRSRIRDYLILASDLVLNGEAITPQAGDRIVESDGATFELLRLTGEPEWRWSDPTRRVYRIHVQQGKSQ